MEKHFIILILLACVVGTAHAQYIINIKHMDRGKKRLDIPAYVSEYKKLVKQVDKMMRMEPVTVMNKEMTPASGTKHDDMSLGQYYWPDTTKADGLPWIQRDGQPNPELKNYDPETRTFVQIEPDGKQPLELKRTLAYYYYSLYNLTHILDVFFIAKSLGLEVGGDTKHAFERVYKAFDFFADYLGKTADDWPYKQISGWVNTRQLLRKELYRAWLIDSKLKKYPILYLKYGVQDWSNRLVLLYLKSDLSDNGYASAEKQLRFALKCASEEYAFDRTKNGDRLVSPRCLEKDVALRLVIPRGWCSGFFAGNLWQMYEG